MLFKANEKFQVTYGIFEQPMFIAFTQLTFLKLVIIMLLSLIYPVKLNLKYLIYTMNLF